MSGAILRELYHRGLTKSLYGSLNREQSKTPLGAFRKGDRRINLLAGAFRGSLAFALLWFCCRSLRLLTN